MTFTEKQSSMIKFHKILTEGTCTNMDTTHAINMWERVRMCINILQYQHEEENFPSENFQHRHDINERGIDLSDPKTQLLHLEVAK